MVITGDELPAGVTLEGGSKTVALAGNESKWVDLRFLLSRTATPPLTGWEYGFGQPITLKAEGSGKTAYTYLGINIVEPQVHWSWSGKPIGVYCILGYTIFADGNFKFSRAVVNDNVLGAKFWFKFYLDGIEYGNMSGSVGSALGDDHDIYSYGFVRDTFRDEYVRWMRAAPYFRYHVET